MEKVTVKVIDHSGFHARPMTIAVKAASMFIGTVGVAYKGKRVDMKSILGVLSLGVPYEGEITIDCEGDGEKEALEEILKAMREARVIA